MKSRLPLEPRLTKLHRGTSITTSSAGPSAALATRGFAMLGEPIFEDRGRSLVSYSSLDFRSECDSADQFLAASENFRLLRTGEEEATRASPKCGTNRWRRCARARDPGPLQTNGSPRHRPEVHATSGVDRQCREAACCGECHRRPGDLEVRRAMTRRALISTAGRQSRSARFGGFRSRRTRGPVQAGMPGRASGFPRCVVSLHRFLPHHSKQQKSPIPPIRHCEWRPSPWGACETASPRRGPFRRMC